MQIKKKNVFYLCISVALLVILPLSSQIIAPNLELDYMPANTSDTTSNPIPNEALSIYNASQYNVSEYSMFLGNKTGLRIGEENATMEVPDNWDVSGLTLEVPTVYETQEIFSEHNLNGNFTGTSDPWDETTTFPYFGDDNMPYARFEYDDVNEWGMGTYNGGDTGYLPGFIGGANTSVLGYNRAGSNLEIGEKYRNEESIYPKDMWDEPLDNQFYDDPKWDELIDPYGGYKGNSEVTAEWVAGIDALRHTINSKWSLVYGYGSPSVAYGTQFYLPFEADSVSITYRYRVENLGYEAFNTMAIVSLIDHQQVNGSVGINGEDYSYDTGNEALLEYDGINITTGYEGDVASHDYYERTFNITDLLGAYGYRTGMHYLDFGVFLITPFENNDDVIVEWDYISINATHYEWNKAAQLDFDFTWNELDEGRYDQDEGGSLALGLYMGGEHAIENISRVFLAYTKQLISEFTYHVSIILPHHYKDAFEVDDFYFYVGMEWAGPIIGDPEFTREQKSELIVDNFSLVVNYNLGSPEALGLEMRLNDGGGWMEVNSTNTIQTLVTDPNLEIEFNISGVSEPYIRYYAYVMCHKYSEDAAFSSVSIETFLDPYSVWNTTYDNNDSLNEAGAVDPYSAIFLYYWLKIENLPAFDGLGNESFDWYLSQIEAPSRADVTSYMNKESDDPFLQNVTVSFFVWGEDISQIKGEWHFYAAQWNYMEKGDLYLDGGIVSERFYHANASEYQLEVRNFTGQMGNYQVNMYNSSYNLTQNFPKYYNNVEENQTYDWSVNDEGVGIYFIYSVWNDTDGSSQTKRFGWHHDTFSIWRAISYSIAEGSGGISVASGDFAEYNLQVDSNLGSGVEGAGFNAFNNGTGSIWGTDWPPYTYLLHQITDNGLGSYTITLRTVNVPLGSYGIHFTIHMGYHDFTITTTTGLIITGATGSMDITYVTGAFEYEADKAYLYGNNIPYVNESSNAQIEVSLEDTGTPLRDAYISASFINNSLVTVTESALMVAVEKYSITFAETDKGIYILTLDTTFLHETTDNYTLSVSFFKAGYFTEVHNVSVQVDPIPLVINAENIDSQYELEDITIQASTFLNSTGSLDPYQYATIYYSIENSTGDYQFGGLMEHTISNVFEVIISLSGTLFLEAGNYTAILNGTGTDLTTSYSEEIDFTVYPKYVTLLDLTFPTEVRIGNYFSISSKLQYANLTEIANEDIELTINYSSTYSYQVLVETDTDGKAVYDLLISEYYEGNTFSVFAQYSGTEILNASWTSKSQVILGKIPVNITFTETPSALQVGYNATWEAQLSILYEQDYEGEILTMYGYYNFDGNLSQPFLIRELATDSNGTVAYTIDEIEDGNENISIYFEFQGDLSVEDEYESTFGAITPKWNSQFTLADFPSEIRLGQTIPIELTLSSSDIGFMESFAVMPITIEFDYGTLKQDFLYYTDENGSLYYEVQIPNSGVTSVNYTVSFPGTAKIEPFTISDTVIILPKLTTTLELDSPSLFGTQRAGTFAYSATLTDSESNPVANATVFFRIYDDSDEEIYSYSSMTNNEGVAAISIPLETTGIFSVTAEFEGEGIYTVATSAEATIEVVSNVMYYVRMLPYIGGGLAIVVAVGFIYQYAVVVPKRKKRLTSLKTIHQRFNDVENIQYILILTKAGLSVFSRSFTSVPIEETLISGFLTAISSFGAEIGGKMKGGSDGEKGLEQLSYKQFKIIVDDAAISRTALLLLKDASPTLKEKLHRFNLRFQEKYMDILQNFSGEIPAEGPILEMVEHFMEVDLLYPHNINTAKLEDFRKTLDKKSIDRKILEAGHEPPFHDIFYVRDMMNTLRESGEEDIHIFNGIIELREKHGVFAINPRTRELIDQFKPVIDQLPDDSKKILLQMFDGVRSESLLRKTKGVRSYDQGIASLLQMGLINNDLSITPSGEAIATILRLV